MVGSEEMQDRTSLGRESYRWLVGCARETDISGKSNFTCNLMKCWIFGLDFKTFRFLFGLLEGNMDSLIKD